MSRSLLIVSVLLATACASAAPPAQVTQDGQPSGTIQLIVRNDFSFPITVELYWEKSGRTALGELGGRGATRTFSIDHRDEGLTLFVRETAGGVRAGPEDSHLATTRRPQTFLPVRPGDRLEAIVRGASRSGGYVGLVRIGSN